MSGDAFHVRSGNKNYQEFSRREETKHFPSSSPQQAAFHIHDIDAPPSISGGGTQPGNPTQEEQALLGMLLAWVLGLFGAPQGNAQAAPSAPAATAKSSAPRALEIPSAQGTSAPPSKALVTNFEGSPAAPKPGGESVTPPATSDALPAGFNPSNENSNTTLGKNQRALLDALTKKGATDEEKKLALSIQLVESNDGITHDATKDGRTDGARNFSPLNMNEQMLRENGVTGDLTRLNNPQSSSQWNDVAGAFLSSLRKEGKADFIHHLRDGYGTDVPDTTADYKRGLAAQQHVLETRGIGHRTDEHVDHLSN